MSGWWAGLAPAETVIPCGEQQHRLRWESGELHALDHGDPDDERALAALGGGSCECLDALDAWEHHRDDLRLLVLSSRGAFDTLASPEDASNAGGFSRRPRPSASLRRVGPPGRGFSRAMVAFGSTSSPARPARRRGPARRNEELALLLGLGGGVADRLVATVAAAWRERIGPRSVAPKQARARLEAALYGRATPALRALRSEPEATVQVTMIRERAAPKLTLGDGTIHAELPFAWVVDVWSKGLATIWGRFCIAASTDDGVEWDLLTVAPDLGDPERIRLRLGG